jgi:Galactose oxidase, central domain/Kelch motif
MRTNGAVWLVTSIALAVAVGCEAQVPSPAPAQTTSTTAAPSPARTLGPYPTLNLPTPTPDPTPEPTPAAPDGRYWTRGAHMAEPRDLHTATRLLDGRVLVVGGRSLLPGSDGDELESHALATTEVFDPATGAWSPGPKLNDARTDHTSTLLPDGRVLVGGGYRSNPGSNRALEVTSVEIFDPETNRWTKVAERPERHGWATATLLRDDRVLVVGWTDRDAPREQAASIFDPGAGSWRATASTGLIRGGHGTVLLGDGTVLLVGGTHADAHETSPMPDAAVYDPEADTWRNVGPMPIAVFAPLMARLLDGDVLVQGHAGATLYDPSTREWAAAPASGDRQREAWVGLADGRVLILDDYPGRIAIYDPARGAWDHLGQFKELSNAPFTLLGDGRVLVTGGYVGCYRNNPCADGEVAEVWLFDATGGD